MYRSHTIVIVLMVLVFIVSCRHNPIHERNDITMKLFEKHPVRFLPDEYKDTAKEENGFIIAANGRLVLKRIHLPDSDGYASELSITLRSMGDPWDKAGSCFIFSADNKQLLDALINTVPFTKEDAVIPMLPGIVATGDYTPAVELMRFMTPFGVGAFSDAEKNPPPAFIDSWANYVIWSSDVTELVQSLPQDVYIGIWIDTWTKTGYSVDASLLMKPDNRKVINLPKKCMPLINTVFYSQAQGYPDIFSRQSVSIAITIPADVSNAVLYYTTTGHGGHEGGDEFVQKKNSIALDGKEVFSFTPWRTDCSTFRRFNPSSGVWLVKQKMRYFDDQTGKSITGEVNVPLASSDLSRSNWCPGSSVDPMVITLGALKKGQHTVTISIPESQKIEGDKMNFWLVSAYIVTEK